MGYRWFRDSDRVINECVRLVNEPLSMHMLYNRATSAGKAKERADVPQNHRQEYEGRKVEIVNKI